MANYGSWTKVPALLAICVIIAAQGRLLDLDSHGTANAISFMLGEENKPSDSSQRSPAYLETQNGGIIVQQCVCAEKLSSCLCKKGMSGGITNLPSYGLVRSTDDFNTEIDRVSYDGARAKKDASHLSAAQRLIDSLPLEHLLKIMYNNQPEELREMFLNYIYNTFIRRSRLS